MNPLTFLHLQILQLGPGQTRGFLKQVTAAVETGFLDFQNRELPLFPDQLTDFDFLVNIDLSYNKIDRIPPAITNMVQVCVFLCLCLCLFLCLCLCLCLCLRLCFSLALYLSSQL